MKAPIWFWRMIQLGPRLFYKLGLGAILGRSVLLLGTHGRKTGKLRQTPLVYEQTGGHILVASARGQAADWLQNIAADPHVQVQIGKHKFAGAAELVKEPDEIAEYLERQLQRNPRMFGAILRTEGLRNSPTREDLLQLAVKRPMVKIQIKERGLDT